MLLWIILIVYLIVMVGIGVYCKRKTSSVSDFVLGGRGLGGWFTAFAYGTSYFSAVVFIGYAGQFGWNYGVAATWIGIGNAVIGSLMAWLILGKRTRIMSKHLNASTMPEFFEHRYGSKPLKFASSGIVFVFLIPYTASSFNGLSRLFEMAFGIPYEFCIIGMAVLTAIYVILGGYMATAINDFVQGIIMIGGIAAVVIFAIVKKGGIYTALTSLGQITDGVPANSLNSIFGPDPWNLIGVILLTSLGTWGLPQMIGKFYTIKDNKAIKRGTIVSTLFCLIIAGGSYFLGGFGRLYTTTEAITNPATGAPVYDTIIPTMLSVMPDILMGIVVVLVLSASMSTLSSLVLTSSSTLTIDMVKPAIERKKPMSERFQVTLMRVFIGAFLLISVIIALNPNAYISTLMSISWGALAGSFLAPFMYGLFSKKITRAAVWTSFAFGVGFTVTHMFLFNLGIFPELTAAVASWNFPINLLSPINCGAFTMLFSLILVPIVSIFTRKPEKAVVDHAFEGYKKNI